MSSFTSFGVLCVRVAPRGAPSMGRRLNASSLAFSLLPGQSRPHTSRAVRRPPLAALAQVNRVTGVTGVSGVNGTTRTTRTTRTNVSASSATTTSSSSSSPSSPSSSSTTTWRIKMLYDSDCPLCMREVDMLRRRDARNNYIEFVDIASPSYRPEDNAGISFEQAMERIHGVYPDGSFVVDIAAFKAFYELVGLGWVYKITEIGFVNKALSAVYAVWAANRLSITGRPDIETILREKKTCRNVVD